MRSFRIFLVALVMASAAHATEPAKAETAPATVDLVPLTTANSGVVENAKLPDGLEGNCYLKPACGPEIGMSCPGRPDTACYLYDAQFFCCESCPNECVANEAEVPESK